MSDPRWTAETLDAAARLRALVAALPEALRQHSWDSDYGLVFSSRYGTGGEVVAVAQLDHLASADELKATAKHIAAVASPPVVLALADHMTAVERMAQAIADADGTRHDGQLPLKAWVDVLRTRDALDAALNREPQT